MICSSKWFLKMYTVYVLKRNCIKLHNPGKRPAVPPAALEVPVALSHICSVCSVFHVGLKAFS